MSNQASMTLRPRAKPSRNRKRKRVENPEETEDSDDGRAGLIAPKSFCNFCGDHMVEKMNRCVDCGSYMCEQAEPNSSGCIWVGTVDAGIDFRCIVCEPKHWRKQLDKTRGEEGRFPYGFTGYGGRKRSKLPWPLVFLSLSLSTLPDKYMRDSMQLDLKNHFMVYPKNLHSVHALFKHRGEEAAKSKFTTAVTFIQESISCGFPANVFLLIDTHSGINVGALQWGTDDGYALEAHTGEVVSKFCGKQLLDAMKETTNAARGQKSDGHQEMDWYDASPYSRGGWRGLFLSTCSPAMRAPESFDDLKSLLERDVFDFILGFAGSSTLPMQVKHVFSQVAERIAVDKTAGIWDTVSRVIGQDLAFLEVNTAVVIYRERGTDAVLSRKIGRHFPPLRPWGVEFHACATPGCEPDSRDLDVRSDGHKAKVVCRICGWKSAWVKAKDRDNLVFQLDSTLPTIYWHQYPPSEALKKIFVNVSDGKEKQGGGDITN